MRSIAPARLQASPDNGTFFIEASNYPCRVAAAFIELLKIADHITRFVRHVIDIAVCTLAAAHSYPEQFEVIAIAKLAFIIRIIVRLIADGPEAVTFRT